MGHFEEISESEEETKYKSQKGEIMKKLLAFILLMTFLFLTSCDKDTPADESSSETSKAEETTTVEDTTTVDETSTEIVEETTTTEETSEESSTEDTEMQDYYECIIYEHYLGFTDAFLNDYEYNIIIGEYKLLKSKAEFDIYAKEGSIDENTFSENVVLMIQRAYGLDHQGKSIGYRNFSVMDGKVSIVLDSTDLNDQGEGACIMTDFILIPKGLVQEVSDSGEITIFENPQVPMFD